MRYKIFKIFIILIILPLIFYSQFFQKTTTPTKEKSSTLGAITISSPTPTFIVSSPKISQGKKQELYLVTKVVDGDTIAVNLNGKIETLRLIGIDTPETVDPRKPVQCFGHEASDKAKEVLGGQAIYLEADPSQGERDKYNRLLRYVFLQDGTNFNQMMIAQGFAHEYTYGSKPYKYQLDFKNAQNAARVANLGLWNPNACSKSFQSQRLDYKSAGSTQSAVSADKDCRDFKTQAQAQEYFSSKNGSSKNNVDGLDSDHDGIACESLP